MVKERAYKRLSVPPPRKKLGKNKRGRNSEESMKRKGKMRKGR